MNQDLCEDSQEIRPNLGGLHILLFDPQKSKLAYTKSLLKRAFYTVITTGDQSMALKMLEENAELIDLIMIDDEPQEMDCITFIKKIKATMESIPIVLLSDKEVYLSAALLQVGACRVVPKPINSAQVKSLWKFSNIWRKKAYYNRLETAVESMDKQPMPVMIDSKEKGKLLSVDNCNSNNNKRQLDRGDEHDLSKKRNYEKFESDYDEHDDECACYDRKKIRSYTRDIHKKCLEVAQNRNKVSPKAAFSTSSSPFIPSSTLLRMIKDNAAKNSPERVQFPRLNTNDASKIEHSIMKPDFGFPTSRVLGSTPTSTNSYDVIGMQSRSFHSSQNSYFGEQRIINNDLKRFSKLVDNQTSLLASNGEYMRQRHLSDSQFRLSPTANTSSYSLNSGFIPSINSTSWQSVVNVENNASSAFGSVPPMTTKLPNEDVNINQWVESVMTQDELYPDSEGFDEISMEEFFKGVFDNPEGSTSTTQSSVLFGGFEANVDHSTLNLKSFTENDYLNGPIDELFLNQENFGNGISGDEDILIDIAGQLEGIF